MNKLQTGKSKCERSVMKGTILCFYTDFSAMDNGDMFTIEKKNDFFFKVM